MALDRATVEHLARLSRLALTDSEAERLGADLARTLAMIDQLQRIDVAGTLPLDHPQELALVLRPDAVGESDQSTELLALAGESQGGYYLVPKVIE
jgi:aspartyl-tRNA(Asn)/glutamyl-tRNA(Gln) amidotransferase subunit C